MIIKISDERRLEFKEGFEIYLKSLGYNWEKLLSFRRHPNGILVYTLRD